MLQAWLDRIEAIGRFHDSFPTRLRRELGETVPLEGVMQHDKTRKLSRQETKERSGLRSEIYTKTYGRVPAPQFFESRHWRGKALRCFRSLKEVRDGIAFANGLPKLVAAFKQLREFRKRMEEVHGDHEAAFANLALDWWKGACHWANTAPQPEGTYAIVGRTITFDDDTDDGKIWKVPTRAELGESMWPEIGALWPR